MTRGMKGCYVYCMNVDLQNYLKRKSKFPRALLKKVNSDIN